MGYFASMTVEWDPWRRDGDAWVCHGMAEVAGNTALLAIDVEVIKGIRQSAAIDPPDVVLVTARWDGGGEPKDVHTRLEAERQGMLRARERP
jgi:hypothetical protein